MTTNLAIEDLESFPQNRTWRTFFRNEPPGNKIFAILVGGLLPGFTFAFAVYGTFTSDADLAGKIIGLAGLMVMGFIFVGVVWPKFILTRYFTLDENNIVYRDFWSTTKIQYGNIVYAMTVFEGRKFVVMFMSKYRSAIGLGDGFLRREKDEIWKLVCDRIAPYGPQLDENLAKSEALEKVFAFEENLSTDPNSTVEEEITHNITKALLVLGFGFIFTFAFLLLSYGFLSAILPTGFSGWTILWAILTISMLLMFAGFILKRWKLIGWSIYGLVIAMILFGLQMGIAEGAWGFSAFIFFMAALIFVLGRATVRDTQGS